MSRLHFSLICLGWLFLMPCLLAQAPERYVRAGILLSGRDISALAQLGLDVEHGLHLPGTLWVADLSESELAQVRKAGFEVKIWIDDLQKDYEARFRGVETRNFPCPNRLFSSYPTPVNYTYGSMGGYHTLEEMMAVLDDMRAKFPHLVSARTPVTSAPAHTWEGRKIWYARISDNPDVDEAEPEVLYTALHHAREPNSASQMLYFMWFLLEHYDTHPLVRYIVDNAELYFIPCVNPDGYVFNQTINPNGGGMWRKNRRNNNNGSFGVDLNRNYGYFWGVDNIGSSPLPVAETYRGPEPFSEPETRAIRDFTLSHQFVFVQDYHTHGNLIIYPWGYLGEVASPAFTIFSNLFARENGYRTGTGLQTLGYYANGISNDWTFGFAGAYAFTPEVGHAFWPFLAQIERLNRECLWLNLATALCALQYGEAKEISPPTFESTTPVLAVRFTRYGMQEGPFTITLTPLTSDVLSVFPAFHQIKLSLHETSPPLYYHLQLNPSISPGTEIPLLLSVRGASYTYTDTLRKVYSVRSSIAYRDEAVSLNEWSGLWRLTNLHFCSAPTAFTDSPEGDYAPNSVVRFISKPVSLPAHARAARLRFCARWQIEPGFDYVQVRAFNDKIDLPLCGRYTRTAISPEQPIGEPIYEGQQLDWVDEHMDLSAFIGQTFRIAFVLTSDKSFQMDGFYFDDLIVEYDEVTVSATEPSGLSSISLYSTPNPANEYALIHWKSDATPQDKLYLTVFDALGRLVGEWPIESTAIGQLRLPTAQWPEGTYFYGIRSTSDISPIQRLVVLRP